MTTARWASSSDRYLTPGQGDAWAAEAASTGQRGTQQLLDVATVPAPADVADALQLAAGEPVIRRRRLILADDRPVELATSYYPVDIAADTPLAGTAKIRGGAVGLLAELGFRAQEAREELMARTADAEELGHLRLDPGAAVLVLSRTILDPNGRAYEHSVMVTTRPQRYVRT
ncbi:GntR family transcriptional regulator [Micromonospora zhanjiangensis]|uniref:GntR family transcriptional regulator n=1 Tax=Micromonospora zhanjiangensis TaxID=1522057 RepID=A0ABV8KUJ3_9ACTN